MVSDISYQRYHRAHHHHRIPIRQPELCLERVRGKSLSLSPGKIVLASGQAMCQSHKLHSVVSRVLLATGAPQCGRSKEEIKLRNCRQNMKLLSQTAWRARLSRRRAARRTRNPARRVSARLGRPAATTTMSPSSTCLSSSMWPRRRRPS